MVLVVTDVVSIQLPGVGLNVKIVPRKLVLIYAVPVLMPGSIRDHLEVQMLLVDSIKSTIQNIK
eukprot:6532643-Ditylum_brightwellii.AAC.1